MWQDGFVNLRNSSLRFMCIVQGVKKVMLQYSTLFGFHPVCSSHKLWIFSLSYSFFLVADANKYIWNSISQKRSQPIFGGLLSFQMWPGHLRDQFRYLHTAKKRRDTFSLYFVSVPLLQSTVVPLQAFLVVIKSDVLNILKILKRVRFKNSFVFHGHYYKATV